MKLRDIDGKYSAFNLNSDEVELVARSRWYDDLEYYKCWVYASTASGDIVSAIVLTEAMAKEIRLLDTNIRERDK